MHLLSHALRTSFMKLSHVNFPIFQNLASLRFLPYALDSKTKLFILYRVNRVNSLSERITVYTEFEQAAVCIKCKQNGLSVIVHILYTFRGLCLVLS